MAIDGGEWVETCDNSEGGISIEWAFHSPYSLIDSVAFLYFMETITDEAQRGLDDDWDLEQWRAFARRFT